MFGSTHNPIELAKQTQISQAQGLQHAGFTTLRSAGEADIGYPAVAVARAIARGEFEGPRIVGAGHYISVTGGGGDINDFSCDNGRCAHADGLVVDGTDAMRVADNG